MSANPNPTTAIRDAEAPFSGAADPEDNIPPPDFILQSGDGVDLHVHKDILKHVSVFFSGMLDTVNNSTGHGIVKDGKPVVILIEPGAVLYRLLCIAYPVQSLEHHTLTAQNLDGIWAVHQTANKYLFLGVQELIERMLEKILQNSDLAAAQPQRIFAIARLCHLPDLARKAGLCSLQYPICPPGVFPELDFLTTVTFHKLYEFHHACGIAAQNIVAQNAGWLDPRHTPDPTYEYITCSAVTGEELVWWKAGSSGYHSEGCGPRFRDIPEDVQVISVQWFEDHAVRLGLQLRAVPTGHTVETEALKVAPVEREVISGCHACLQHAEEDLKTFAEQLAPLLEASNNRLALDL
ncbi:hypothetical protein C8R43DRAFT_1126923 [Mycena crocata]|nr:hypothetical protein C8R43DRAFT_1126923 [Mycena crocata]